MRRIFLTLAALALLAGCGGDETAATDPLDGTSWELVSIGKSTALAEVAVTAAFAAGRVSGSAGCNNYFASYEALGERLTVGRPGSTMMACPEEIMAQEQRVLGLLAEAQTFRLLADGNLAISRSDGESLTFRPAPDAGP